MKTLLIILTLAGTPGFAATDIKANEQPIDRSLAAVQAVLADPGVRANTNGYSVKSLLRIDREVDLEVYLLEFRPRSTVGYEQCLSVGVRFGKPGTTDDLEKIQGVAVIGSLPCEQYHVMQADNTAIWKDQLPKSKLDADQVRRKIDQAPLPQ